jgi:hypothetical protein
MELERPSLAPRIHPGIASAQYFERLRHYFFKAWYQALGGEIVDEIDFIKTGEQKFVRFPPFNCTNSDCEMINDIATPDLEALRIHFISADTLMGNGAETIQDTVHIQIHKTLTAAKKNTRRIQTINTSLYQYDINTRFETAAQLSREFKPHYVVLSLHTFEQTKEPIQKFISTLIAQGASLIYLYDPMNLDNVLHIKNYPELHYLRQSLKYVRRRSEVPVFKKSDPYFNLFSHHEVSFIDPNERLLTQENIESGFLWLDSQLLTSHGQQLTGKIIGEELLEIFKGDQTMRKFFE